MAFNKSLSSLLLSFAIVAPLAAAKPNIVIIFADDMGYGDVQVLNPERGKIKTPQLDAMASQGMIFTDAHTSSSVCTPSRYSLITGRYSWRSTIQRGVLNGYGEPLIPEDRLTIASLLKNQGYNTAMIGKWHIGLNLPTVNDEKLMPRGLTNVDWAGEIKGGPYDLGFDYFYGISASLDMHPYVYIENDKFVGEGTVIKAFSREGVAHVDFEAVDVLDKLAEKSVEFINNQSKETPFFAYIALPSPHTPIVPTPEWQGKSEVGSYGDFMMQTDAFVGTVSQALDDKGFTENTLFIVTSDNGCSKAAKIEELQSKGHYPSAQFRGSKADLWEGGHRVPFLVKWPASVKAGLVSDETICLTDVMATCAEVSAATLPADAGEDSVSFLPALLGQEIKTSRKGIIHHSITGHFAYREGKWKLLLAKGSAGWTEPKEHQAPADSPKGQLYDMEADPGETKNLYKEHPEVVEGLLKRLTEYVNSGRSTDGDVSENDFAKIELWKSALGQKSKKSKKSEKSKKQD